VGSTGFVAGAAEAPGSVEGLQGQRSRGRRRRRRAREGGVCGYRALFQSRRRQGEVARVERDDGGSVQTHTATRDRGIGAAKKTCCVFRST
jgi:hypothetical protein